MKRTLLFFCFFAFAIGNQIFAQNVNIPDPVFKNYLVSNAMINTNSDTEIQVSEAASFTGQILCNSLAINSLIGIEAFTSISHLECRMNNLTSLDLSNNTALVHLDIRLNSINNLDISNLNLLQWFHCSNNEIESLDLSSMTFLTDLNCTNNNLNYLNIQNGNNAAFAFIHTFSNVGLSCIQVDSELFSNSNWTGSNFQFGVNTQFSTICPPPLCNVYIPDVNFRTYLLNNPAVNINGDGYIQCDEAQMFSGSLFCDGLSILDLTGIETFTNLSALYCNNNSLSSLNLTSNLELITLQCSGNQLSSLNINGLISLDVLNCYTNLLTSIDLSSNTSLTEIQCHSNLLTSINIANNPFLLTLGCSQNQLSVLDISSNSNLAYLYCGSNELTSLNIPQNSSLVEMNCSYNQLNQLNVSNLVQLNSLNCSSNNLSALNVKNGNNVNFINFDARFNTDLQCIEVDDQNWSNGNWTSYINGLAYFLEQCELDSISQPTNLNASIVNAPLSVFLSWEDNSDNEDGFSLEREIEGGFFNVVATLPANSTQYTDTDISSNSNYSYRIRAFSNSIGFSSFSNTVQISTSPLSLNIQSMSELKIYPNPVESSLTIQTNEATRFEILDVFGKAVFTDEFHSYTHTVDVNHLVGGIYFLKISNGKTVPFIKK